MNAIVSNGHNSILDAHKDLITILKKTYKRNVWEFEYILIDDTFEHILISMFLEKYLKHNSVPYTFNCIYNEVPPLYYYRHEKKTTDGIFHIYPDTERELFIIRLTLEKISIKDSIFVACRTLDDYNVMMKDLKKFFKDKIIKDKLILSFSSCREIDIFEPERVSWDDVILPPSLYRSIRLSIENFFKAEGFYKKHGLPFRRGLLLAGPPGNGKTMLCKAIANEMDIPFIFYEIQDSEDFNIKNAFEIAEEMGPCILCFEDLHVLEGGYLNLSYFLNLIDGLKAREGVLILATTNKPEQIDAALSNRPSRFDSVFRIEKPDEHCRRRMLRRHFKDMMEEQLLEDLARKTSGFSMAYLKELYILSMLLSMQRGSDVPSSEDIYSAFDLLKKQIRHANKPVQEKTFAGFDVE